VVGVLGTSKSYSSNWNPKMAYSRQITNLPTLLSGFTDRTPCQRDHFIATPRASYQRFLMPDSIRRLSRPAVCHPAKSLQKNDGHDDHCYYAENPHRTWIIISGLYSTASTRQPRAESTSMPSTSSSPGTVPNPVSPSRRQAARTFSPATGTNPELRPSRSFPN